jgi:hypothetical protein
MMKTVIFGMMFCRSRDGDGRNAATGMAPSVAARPASSASIRKGRGR